MAVLQIRESDFAPETCRDSTVLEQSLFKVIALNPKKQMAALLVETKAKAELTLVKMRI